MSKILIILMMAAGSIVFFGCSDDVTSDPPVANDGDAVSATADVVGVNDTGNDEQSDDSVSVSSSDVPSDDASVTDDAASDESEGQPDVVVEEQQSAGDPTEDPEGGSSSFYEFAAWEIPAQDQNKEDDR